MKKWFKIGVIVLIVFLVVRFALTTWSASASYM